jgi:hypothetical protein
MHLKVAEMNDKRKADISRRDKPWPRFMDHIFEANMIDGTLRMVGSILVFVAVFGTLFWWLD